MGLMGNVTPIVGQSPVDFVALWNVTAAKLFCRYLQFLLGTEEPVCFQCLLAIVPSKLLAMLGQNSHLKVQPAK